MDGVVVLLKPPGMTSSNAVYDVRRIFSEKRAGHLGTLDPGAAGVLPICIGRATRLFDYLVDKQKSYICEIAFGAATDTQDVFGAVVERSDKVISPEALVAVLPGFVGVQQQEASVYSALKVGGKKMYDIARAGGEVVPKTREITISELEMTARTGVNRYLLRLTCSRGTYVRSLCADIGKRLNTCAHMSFLLRTASGPFSLEQANSVPELEALRERGALASAVVSCEEALAFLPAVTLSSERRRAAVNALETFVPGQADGPVRLYCDGFLGIGDVRGGQCKLAVHLYDRVDGGER